MTDDRTLVARAQADDGSEPAALIERYLEGGATVRQAIAGMDDAQLRARPVPGKMSTQEVVGHLVDADQFMCDRMKRTIATDLPLLMGVDGIAYLEALHYAARDVALDLRLIVVQRDQLSADLRRLAPEAWERTAVHSENGLVTLRQLLLHAIRHLERHVDAIHEKRTALGL
jgi:uncharacterized damage-inducible protein DinB